MASPDKTPQRPQGSASARPAEWESYAFKLEADVVRLHQERDEWQEMRKGYEDMVQVRDERVERLREALLEALELERSFVHKDGAHSATVKVLEAALVASPDKPPGS